MSDMSTSGSWSQAQVNPKLASNLALGAFVAAVALLAYSVAGSTPDRAVGVLLAAAATIALAGTMLAALAKMSSVVRSPGCQAEVLPTYATAAGRFAMCAVLSLGVSLTSLVGPSGGSFTESLSTVVLLTAVARVAGWRFATDDRARRGL